jgi:hypothetical protein
MLGAIPFLHCRRIEKRKNEGNFFLSYTVCKSDYQYFNGKDSILVANNTKCTYAQIAFRHFPAGIIRGCQENLHDCIICTLTLGTLSQF